MTTKSTSELLAQLGIDRDGFRVVGLIPLLYVAWADGKMQRAERAHIRSVAAEKGWLAGNAAAVLDRWLEQPPTDEEVRCGLELVRALARDDRGLGTSVPESTLASLLVMCRDVAAAAGGQLGLADAISDDEASALDRVAEALGLADGRSWRELVEELDARPAPEAPSPPGNVLLGHIPAFARDPVAFLLDASRLGDVVRLRIPGLGTAFLLRRPEHVKHVLADNARNYVRGEAFRVLAKLAGDSMITTEGEAWRKLRRISQPAFHKRALHPMATTITRLCGEELDRWQERAARGEPIDASDELSRLTMRVIGHLLCSIDLSDETSALGEAVTVALDHINAVMTNPFHLPQAIPTPANLRFKRAMETFHGFIGDVIAERRNDATPRHDILGMLLDARDEETGEGLSDAEIINEMLTYLIAGHETTATGLTWTLVCLSRHPAIERRLRAEVAAATGGAIPTLDHLPRLGYAAQVFEEAIRLYPPIFLSSRETVSEDEIGGHRIPPGSQVMLSPYVTGRQPDVWPNPEGYDPDRFTEEEVARRHPTAWFPFLAGPHKCIGYPLAMLEVQLMLPMIVQRFRLDLVPGCSPTPKASTTLRPKDPVMMSLHPVGP